MKEEIIKLKEETRKILERIEELEATKDFKIGDKVTYKGLDWVVIKIKNKKKKQVTLMLVDRLPKDILNKVFDSDCLDSDYDVLFDRNTYDWKESYLREKLNSKFLEVLGISKSDLIQMTTNYAQDESVIDYVRIPSFKDIETLPREIIKKDSTYYLMNRGVYRADCDDYKAEYSNLRGVFSFTNYTGEATFINSFRLVIPIITLTSETLVSEEGK